MKSDRLLVLIPNSAMNEINTALKTLLSGNQAEFIRTGAMLYADILLSGRITNPMSFPEGDTVPFQVPLKKEHREKLIKAKEKLEKELGREVSLAEIVRTGAIMYAKAITTNKIHMALAKA